MTDISDELIGQRLGMLVVLSVAQSIRRGNSVAKAVLCRCDCGREKVIRRFEIARGTTKSCGCLKKQIITTSQVRHGLRNSPLYKVWKNMMTRCYDSRVRSFKDYGGRGILVCARWHDLALFVEDMAPSYVPGLTIERRNNDRGYEQENCTWATRAEQNRNKRPRKDSRRHCPLLIG